MHQFLRRGFLNPSRRGLGPNPSAQLDGRLDPVKHLKPGNAYPSDPHRASTTDLRSSPGGCPRLTELSLHVASGKGSFRRP